MSELLLTGPTMFHNQVARGASLLMLAASVSMFVVGPGWSSADAAMPPVAAEDSQDRTQVSAAASAILGDCGARQLPMPAGYAEGLVVDGSPSGKWLVGWVRLPDDPHYLPMRWHNGRLAPLKIALPPGDAPPTHINERGDVAGTRQTGMWSWIDGQLNDIEVGATPTLSAISDAGVVAGHFYHEGDHYVFWDPSVGLVPMELPDFKIVYLAGGDGRRTVGQASGAGGYRGFSITGVNKSHRILREYRPGDRETSDYAQSVSADVTAGRSWGWFHDDVLQERFVTWSPLRSKPHVVLDPKDIGFGAQVWDVDSSGTLLIGNQFVHGLFWPTLVDDTGVLAKLTGLDPPYSQKPLAVTIGNDGVVAGGAYDGGGHYLPVSWTCSSGPKPPDLGQKCVDGSLEFTITAIDDVPADSEWRVTAAYSPPGDQWLELHVRSDTDLVKLEQHGDSQVDVTAPTGLAAGTVVSLHPYDYSWGGMWDTHLTLSLEGYGGETSAQFSRDHAPC